MSHTPHELAEEFPDAKTRIHDLKESDPHFARLADQYHEINREIHRIETNVEPASDLHETDLRKKRLYLKDQISARLNAVES
ncbi:MAG: YdcH family protein [Henriciella sp.]